MNFLPARVDASAKPEAAYRGSSGSHRVTATGQGFSLSVPASDKVSTDIVLGIRPEAISLAATDDGARISANVELREVLGAEVLLHMRSEAGPLTVRTDAHADAREGDNLTVWLDQQAVHLFDAKTEVRL